MPSDDADNILAAVAGPCPDVSVPPSARPRVLLRGSVHRAVSDAQRRLNAAEGERLKDDGDLGPLTRGAKFYDQASTDPFKCQFYIHDANHNFFNTEWVSEDLRRWNPATSSLTTLRSHINVMDNGIV